MINDQEGQIIKGIRPTRMIIYEDLNRFARIKKRAGKDCISLEDLFKIEIPKPEGSVGEPVDAKAKHYSNCSKCADYRNYMAGIIYLKYQETWVNQITGQSKPFEDRDLSIHTLAFKPYDDLRHGSLLKFCLKYFENPQKTFEYLQEPGLSDMMRSKFITQKTKRVIEEDLEGIINILKKYKKRP